MKANSQKFFLFLIGVVFLQLCGCLTIPHNYYSSAPKPTALKDRVNEETRYICTRQEREDLDSLTTDADLTTFLHDFWKRRDPTPSTDDNEFRSEHERRLTFANEHLGGSHLDRGRVYIIYGPPDNRNYDGLQNQDLGSTHVYDIEVWTYNKPSVKSDFPTIFDQLYPGMTKFVFADLRGFGIMEQIYSSEEGEKIDARVYELRY